MRVKLMIIGDGHLKAYLRSLRDALKLEEDVIFTGFQQNPFKFYKHASVFCLASRYEGFPNVVLEAMTLGVPVIVTDCHAGPAEITDAGKYGILVPPEDPDTLAIEILKVLSNRDLREELSVLARKRSEEFGYETSLATYEQLLRSVNR